MSAPSAGDTRAAPWVRRLYMASVAAYAALAILFTAIAYAQPSSSTALPVPTQEFLRPPKGSSDAVVEEYYDYLRLQSYGDLGQTWKWKWTHILDALGFGAAFLIALYFFIFAWFARRRKGDLYPVEVYNGYITERNGSIDAFNWALYTIIAIYAVAYVAMSLRFGQLY